MAGYASMDDFINKLTVLGQIDDLAFFKVGATAEAAGVWQSLWFTAGLPGIPTAHAHAATPGAALTSTPGASVEGSIFYANQSPMTKFLLTFEASPSVDATVVLYDRLYGCSFSLAAAGAQNINPTATVALPRYADGRGVQGWVEIITTAGSPTITAVSYTNEQGTAGRTGTVTLSATPAVSSMYPIRLAAGDLGIRSVQTVTVGTNTATTANVILAKELLANPGAANHWNPVDTVNQLHAIGTQVFDGATLAMMYLPTATTATTFFGQLRLGWG